jgi:hypothetical protein
MSVRGATSSAWRVPAAVGLCLSIALSAAGSAAPARGAVVAAAVADNLTVEHDRTLTSGPPGVLGNDLNLLGGATAVLVSDVTNGELDLRANGGYTYVPDPGFVGTDSFRYKPSGLLSTAADVTIAVTNSAPVAKADAYVVQGGKTHVVPAPGVLANDADADGDSLSAELLDASGVSGSIDLESNGRLVYSPGGGFSGSVTITYRVWDGIAWSASATITLTRAASSPTPTPTPSPTPRPTATPRPSLPLPSLPLPSLPLPSLPLPVLPTPDPTPRPTPAPQPDEPSPSSRPDQAPSSASPPATSSQAPSQTGGGSGGASGGAGGTVPGTVQEGGLQLVAMGEGVGLDIGGVELVGTLDTWLVPATTIGGTGLLVLLFVALQAAGTVAWLPAVRRLRGEERKRQVVVVRR